MRGIYRLADAAAASRVNPQDKDRDMRTWNVGGAKLTALWISVMAMATESTILIMLQSPHSCPIQCDFVVSAAIALPAKSVATSSFLQLQPGRKQLQTEKSSSRARFVRPSHKTQMQGKDLETQRDGFQLISRQTQTRNEKRYSDASCSWVPGLVKIRSKGVHVDDLT